jgi:Tfp pilus assembly protein PilX
MTRHGHTHFASVYGRPSAARRRGAILAAAMVEFVVVAAILFAVLQSVVSYHRRLITGRQQLQSQWLAQAGFDRAVAQLRNSADYRGETWRVPSTELEGTMSGAVQIRVESVADKPDDLHVVVQANYPDDSIHGSQQTREAIVHLK